MIEHLTIDKLVAYGFLADDIERFKEYEKAEVMFHKTMTERYWASNIEQKIYSGLDASRKLYFGKPNQATFPRDELSLLPEYFERKRELFLTARKNKAGAVYNEERSKERFKELEIETTGAEIDQAKKEITNPKNAVSKLTMQMHRSNMEIYLDWLSAYVEAVPEPPPIISIAKTLKPIPTIDYFHIHVKDEATMAFYEQLLQKVNAAIGLNTTIYELPTIFKIIEKWDGILAERLKNAPSKQLAEEEFKKEILEVVAYNDDAASDSPENKERYWNKYRKVTYGFAIKGQAVTMQYLGYLVLKYMVSRPEGEEIIEKISNFPDVTRLIESFAEGAAAGLFVHSDIKTKHTPHAAETALFKPGYDPQVYLNLLKGPTFKVLNDKGEYIYGPRKKSFITAFFDILETNGITHFHPASALAPLINQHIPGLNITPRTLQNTNAKANQMKSYFQSLLDSL